MYVAPKCQAETLSCTLASESQAHTMLKQQNNRRAMHIHRPAQCCLCPLVQTHTTRRCSVVKRWSPLLRRVLGNRFVAALFPVGLHENKLASRPIDLSHWETPRSYSLEKPSRKPNNITSFASLHQRWGQRFEHWGLGGAAYLW